MAEDSGPPKEAQSSERKPAGSDNGADLRPNPSLPTSENQNIPLRNKAPGTVPNSQPGSTAVSQDCSTPKEIADDQEDDGEEGDYGEVTDLPPVQPLKKKKKRGKKKPASQRGQGKPTGFEDFFADAPMTPEQHAEERELYDHSLHFVDRILTAIGRFERTRKLTNERRDILYKYLGHGDVVVGPNSFQGGQDVENMDKAQIASILSQASATEDKRNLGTETSLYEVDFLGCMKAFMSRRAKNLYGFETQDRVQLLTSTLERFMDYLLQHNVCPEYQSDVLATRNFCREAGSEIWDAAEATRRLPGDFNVACSTLFNGAYARNYDGNTWWGPTDTEEQVFVGMKPEEASQIVRFGVAGAASEDVYLSFVKCVSGGDGVEAITLEVVDTKEQVGFEITKIEPPSKEAVDIYTTQSAHFRPVGRVHAKPWKNPDALPEDLTPDEQAALTSPSSSKPHENGNQVEYVFFVESILQSHLRVGMKLEATIRTLNCGIMFFDELLNVYPSFDEFLINEMMEGWKRPKPEKGAWDYVDEDLEGDEKERDNARETDVGGNANGDDETNGAEHQMASEDENP